MVRLGLTLSSGPAYRWAVEPESTGAACPRILELHLQGWQSSRPRAGGASRRGTHSTCRQTRFEIDSLVSIPDTGELIQ